MNPEQIVIELHRENLCTYFILPLLKLNKFSFVTPRNFVESYLHEEGTSIFVKLNDIHFFEHRMRLHAYYKAWWKDEQGKHYIQYSIPEQYQQDVQLFLQGKYSKFSAKAKEMIQIHSGLVFRSRDEKGTILTDTRLLALEKSPLVKRMWEERLAVELDDESELLSMPGDPKWRQLFIDESAITLVS